MLAAMLASPLKRKVPLCFALRCVPLPLRAAQVPLVALLVLRHIAVRLRSIREYIYHLSLSFYILHHNALYLQKYVNTFGK